MSQAYRHIEGKIEDSSIQKTIAQEILYNLFSQKACGKFCDVQFLHGSSTIWAHSCVLASYSPFMKRMFNKYAEENITWSFRKPLQVNISSVSKCNGNSPNNCVLCTCKIIDFIYTGKIKLENGHLEHIVNLSCNLEIDILLLICQRYRRDNFPSFENFNIKNHENNHNDTNKFSSESSHLQPLKINSTAVEQSSHNLTPPSRALKCASLNTANCKKINENDPNEPPGNCEQSKDNSNYSSFNRKELKCFVRGFNLRNEYVCSSCNFKSDNNIKFQLHKKVFHKRKYICLECNFTTFKMTEVVEHLLKTTHEGKVCSICLHEADNPGALHSHIADHKKSYPFKCLVCGQKFKYRNDWVRHKYSPVHEVDLIDYNKKNVVSDENSLNNGAANKCVCKICKFEFSNYELLQKHSFVFHKRKYKCLSCEFNTLKIDKMIAHLTEYQHDENVCSICLFEATNSVSLKDHILDHKNHMPFKCSECQVRFQTRNEWWRHNLAHSSEKPFICTFCGLSFSTSPYLQTHILYRHNVNKHVCKICGYGAPFASKLEKHAIIHSKLKQYKCQEVDCTFNCSSKLILRKHSKLHKALLKPFLCSICNLQFKFNKNLNRHIKLSHNLHNIKLVCPACKYTNNRIDKMKEHCRNLHEGNLLILHDINKQYEETKTLPLPEIVRKKKKRYHNKNNSSLELGNGSEKEKLPTTKHEDALLLDKPKNSDKQYINNPLSEDTLKQTVLLSETTGEINIISENEGKPIPVASLTSTSMLTIGNFREGTGSVTLNETTGVLTLNNINVDSTGAVFLNESTGELSYINLNVENKPNSDILNENSIVKSEHVQLNEVTGEIVTVIDESSVSNKQVNGMTEEDFLFDTIMDFNEDSCDGLDDFDSLFFDTFSPIDSPNVEEILKHNSEGLFSSCHLPRLDEMTGELTFCNESLNSQESNTGSEEMWAKVNTFQEKSVIENAANEVYETLLNEVTGEFS